MFVSAILSAGSPGSSVEAGRVASAPGHRIAARPSYLGTVTAEGDVIDEDEFAEDDENEYEDE